MYIIIYGNIATPCHGADSNVIANVDLAYLFGWCIVAGRTIQLHSVPFDITSQLSQLKETKSIMSNTTEGKCTLEIMKEQRQTEK
jgi:hypothetical protein